MTRLARLALFLLACLTVATAATDDRASPTALASSRITRSYYVGDGSGAAARNLGCANGDKQGRMTLLFGAPTSVDGRYGATLWGAPNRTTGQIAATVREFVRGYAFCRRSAGYRLLIGIGTSNSTIDGRSNEWLRGHGRAWSRMVRNLSNWALTYYPDQVRMYGAWDAEPSWSSYTKAAYWMHGYDAVSGARPLHANSSADGCPLWSASNGSCNNGWNQYRVWHLAWEHDPALPVPQIYATSGANANQWQMIDLYGVRRGDGLYFFGVMSQASACRQVGGCPGTDATPQQSLDLLQWVLNTRRETAQDGIPGATDIRWHS